jgi:hypothetical protein
MIAIGRLLHKTCKIHWKAFLIYNFILGISIFMGPAMLEMLGAEKVEQIRMMWADYMQDEMLLLYFVSYSPVFSVFYLIVDFLKIAVSTQTFIQKFSRVYITLVALYVNMHWTTSLISTSVTFAQHGMSFLCIGIIVAIFKIIERITKYDFETNTYASVVKITKEPIGKAQKKGTINE